MKPSYHTVRLSSGITCLAPAQRDTAGRLVLPQGTCTSSVGFVLTRCCERRDSGRCSAPAQRSTNLPQRLSTMTPLGIILIFSAWLALTAYAGYLLSRDD